MRFGNPAFRLDGKKNRGTFFGRTQAPGASVVISILQGEIFPDAHPTVIFAVKNPGGSVSGVVVEFYVNGILDGTGSSGSDGTGTYIVQANSLDGPIVITAKAMVPGDPSSSANVTVSTPIQFIGAAADINSIPTMPAHQTGDLLLAYAYRDGGTTLTVPAGWNVALAPTAANTNVGVLAWKYAASNSEVSGTWTSATNLAIHVYRGADKVDPIGAVNSFQGTGGTLTYGALTLEEPGGSWVATFVGTRSATSAEVPPAGSSNRSNYVNTTATSEIAGHDTNGAVSTFPQIIGGASGGNAYVSISVEILT